MATQFKDVDGVRFVNGVATKVDTSNVSATPTAAELVAAYGSAASQVGKVFIQDDNGADTTVRLVVSDGTSYFFTAALTKAS
ncbi:hypothetical protein EBZ39_07995 [bacterium]|nr:hypothetical protein [bacterium]